MKPLTSKQRDWIMGLLSMVVTLEGYTDIDMVKALAANAAEDVLEYELGDLPYPKRVHIPGPDGGKYYLLEEDECT